jgi:hypothetical protein
MKWRVSDTFWLVVMLALLAIGTCILPGCNQGLEVNQDYLVAAPADAQMAVGVAYTRYGKFENTFARVYWYGPKAATCNNGTGFWYRDPWTNDGSCVAGATAYDGSESIVLVLPGQRISDTAIAHEMAHAAYGERGHPEWMFGTWERDQWRGGMVGVVIDELTEAGH